MDKWNIDILSRNPGGSLNIKIIDVILLVWESVCKIGPETCWSLVDFRVIANMLWKDFHQNFTGPSQNLVVEDRGPALILQTVGIPKLKIRRSHL